MSCRSDLSLWFWRHLTLKFGSHTESTQSQPLCQSPVVQWSLSLRKTVLRTSGRHSRAQTENDKPGQAHASLEPHTHCIYLYIYVSWSDWQNGRMITFVFTEFSMSQNFAIMRRLHIFRVSVSFLSSIFCLMYNVLLQLRCLFGFLADPRKKTAP